LDLLFIILIMARKRYDYLIVGSGLSGSVLAERLCFDGRKVLVVEKRDHIGGNCYDFYDRNGVLVHKYGPHYFRTDSKRVVEYLSRFTEWRPYEYRVKTWVNNDLYPIPINRDTLNKFFNISLKTKQEAKIFLEKKKENIKNPKNAEEQVLALAGREIYEAFFKNYTIKQWGLDPKNLDASVTARIPIRTNMNDRYFTDKFQAMPRNGYTQMFKNILKNVPVSLNTNFEDIRNDIKYDKLIYTGAIDKFFHYKFGKLPYRSLKFRFERYDKKFYQKWPQINYPNNYRFTRIVEIKHATGQRINRTTIVKEYPMSKGEPFYPIPNSNNRDLYLKYKKEASKLKNVYFVGRLATYQYINMDQVISQALSLFKKIK